MILLIAYMNKIKSINRFKSINDIVNVLFVVGYIVDFLFRKSILDASFNLFALAPFIVNIPLIIYLIYLIFSIQDENDRKNKDKVSVIFKLIFNIIFILLIIYL